MEINARDFRRLLPGLLISLIALAVLVTFVDLQALLRALRGADYRFILAGIFFFLVSLLARAMGWRTLLREQAGVGKVFFAINEGYLLNNLLPFRLGEFGRAFLLSRSTAMSIWQVFSTILVERVFDLALSAGLLLSTLPFVLGVPWARQAALVAAAIVTTGLIFLYVMARNRERALILFEGLSRRMSILQRFGRQRVEGFFDGLAALTDFRRFVQAFGWMALVWGLTIVEYTLILRAFLPSTQLLYGMFSLGVLAVGVAVPASPASIGVFEAALVGALRVFDVDQSVALAYAVAIHLLFVLLTGIFGVYGLARDGQSLGGLYRQVRAEAEGET